MQVTLCAAFVAHTAAGKRQLARDHRGRADRKVAAGQARIAVHQCVELHVAAGSVQVVADRAADRQLAARDHEVALHFIRGRDTTAREDGIALDGVSEVEHSAGTEIVGAEPMRDGLLAVVLDAAAGGDGRQRERDQRHARNSPPQGPLAGHRAEVYGTARGPGEPVAKQERPRATCAARGLPIYGLP